jgi:amino acid transporter
MRDACLPPPTYLFVASFIVILLLGLYAVLTSDRHPQPLATPPTPPPAAETVSLWLLMQAFASGCTAMTGVEAVSNGVTSFREPRMMLARRTLAIIAVTLGVLLAGITYLAAAYGIMAMDQTQPGYQTVLSQLAAAVVGHGAFYYVALASALCILCLSADTSFAAFPQLFRHWRFSDVHHLAGEDGGALATGNQPFQWITSGLDTSWSTASAHW